MHPPDPFPPPLDSRQQLGRRPAPVSLAAPRPCTCCSPCPPSAATGPGPAPGSPHHLVPRQLPVTPALASTAPPPEGPPMDTLLPPPHPVDSLSAYEPSRYRRQLEHALKALPATPPPAGNSEQRLADVMARPSTPAPPSPAAASSHDRRARLRQARRSPPPRGRAFSVPNGLGSCPSAAPRSPGRRRPDTQPRPGDPRPGPMITLANPSEEPMYPPDPSRPRRPPPGIPAPATSPPACPRAGPARHHRHLHRHRREIRRHLRHRRSDRVDQRPPDLVHPRGPAPHLARRRDRSRSGPPGRPCPSRRRLLTPARTPPADVTAGNHDDALTDAAHGPSRACPRRKNRHIPCASGHTGQLSCCYCGESWGRHDGTGTGTTPSPRPARPPR